MRLFQWDADRLHKPFRELQTACLCSSSQIDLTTVLLVPRVCSIVCSNQAAALAAYKTTSAPCLAVLLEAAVSFLQCLLNPYSFASYFCCCFLFSLVMERTVPPAVSSLPRLGGQLNFINSSRVIVAKLTLTRDTFLLVVEPAKLSFRHHLYLQNCLLCHLPKTTTNHTSKKEPIHRPI